MATISTLFDARFRVCAIVMIMRKYCQLQDLMLQIVYMIFCSGLKGRRPFWLLNPPSRGVPSLFLLLISLSGDEEVES